MQETIKVFVALLLAHLLGDFPFQPSRLVAQKLRHWWAHGLHAGIHFTLVILTFLIFVPSVPVFTGCVLVAVAAYVAFHVVIDVSKQQLVKRGVVEDSTNVFLIDQTLHLASMVVLTVFITRIDWPAIQSLMALRSSTKDLILSGGVVYTTVVFAGGYLIRYMTRGLLGGVSSQLGESVEQLTNAGLYIGWLERLLIVTAVVLRSPTMIGLILTAKSIARFPEMKEPKFAEYFLIGTLLSVTMALFGGLVLLKVWYGTVTLQ
jgi:Protein of unknown function (DUF3307)